jgi:hypothetical protein
MLQVNRNYYKFDDVENVNGENVVFVHGSAKRLSNLGKLTNRLWKILADVIRQFRK